MLTSDDAATVVLTAAEVLFAAFESVEPDEVTLAVFENDVAAAGAVPLIVIGAAGPGTTADCVHVTVLVVTEHAQPAPAAVTPVMAAGTTSVIVIVPALSGPPLVTLTVYVIVVPAAMVAGPVFVTPMSATGVTVVEIVAEVLLAAFVSLSLRVPSDA